MWPFNYMLSDRRHFSGESILCSRVQSGVAQESCKKPHRKPCRLTFPWYCYVPSGQQLPFPRYLSVRRRQLLPNNCLRRFSWIPKTRKSKNLDIRCTLYILLSQLNVVGSDLWKSVSLSLVIVEWSLIRFLRARLSNVFCVFVVRGYVVYVNASV